MKTPRLRAIAALVLGIATFSPLFAVSVRGTIWCAGEDANCGHNQRPGDHRLSGVTVALCDENGVILQDNNGPLITTTAWDGFYAFVNLASRTPGRRIFVVKVLDEIEGKSLGNINCLNVVDEEPVCAPTNILDPSPCGAIDLDGQSFVVDMTGVFNCATIVDGIDFVFCETIEECALTVNAGCAIPNPPEAEDACSGSLTSMTLEYTGDDCDGNRHSQDPRKVSCSGDPAVAGNDVFILVNDNENPGRGKVWFQGNVALNGAFLVDAANAGQTDLKSNTWVHVFASEGDALLQSVQFHTSCSQPLAPGNQFGSVLIREMTSTGQGTVTLTEPPPALPAGTCLVSVPPAPHCVGKVEAIQMRYLGGDCSQSNTGQASNKFDCSGNAQGGPVRIVASDGKKKVWLDQTGVNIGDIVELSAANAGQSALKKDTLIEIFAANGDLLQVIEFETSCKQPINLGDRFGALEVFGLDTDQDDPVALGVEVTYTYEVANVGHTDSFNVTVTDSAVGAVPGSPISILAPGEMVTLTRTALVTSDTNSTVTVAGETSAGAVCEATDSVDVIFENPPLPPGPDECTTKLKTILLRYIGPEIHNATVTFSAKTAANNPAVYTGVDLIPGVTVLASPTENNWTIDGTVHGGGDLGAKLTIEINGQQEVIHTSCSVPVLVNEPAPLDNPKGAPSPNWRVEAFSQK